MPVKRRSYETPGPLRDLANLLFGLGIPWDEETFSKLPLSVIEEQVEYWGRRAAEIDAENEVQRRSTAYRYDLTSGTGGGFWASLRRDSLVPKY